MNFIKLKGKVMNHNEEQSLTYLQSSYQGLNTYCAQNTSRYFGFGVVALEFELAEHVKMQTLVLNFLTLFISAFVKVGKDMDGALRSIKKHRETLYCNILLKIF